MTAAMPKGVVPPGRYAGGGRSPIVWVFLCPPCGGYAPMTSPDYSGFLSGQCQGCGAASREVHRFTAVLKTDDGCGCRGSHPRAAGDLPAAAGRYAWTVTPPLNDLAEAAGE